LISPLIAVIFLSSWAVSGCGKSTLLMHLIGLQHPAKGDVFYGEESLWQAEHKARQRILQRTGVYSRVVRC